MTFHPDELHDDVGAYLLDALEDTEREAFETHLQDCSACQAEVVELQPAAWALPASVEPMAPPTALRDRIMLVVDSEAQLMASAAGPRADLPDVPEAAQRRGWRAWGLLGRPAFALGLVVVVLTAGAVVGRSVGTDDGGPAPSAPVRTLAATVDASQAPGASARVLVHADDAQLVVSGMPAPPEGRVYQVWLKRRGEAPKPTSSLFAPRADGKGTVSVPSSLKEGEQVLVTDEPLGGSRAPTRTPVIAAQVA